MGKNEFTNNLPIVFQSYDNSDGNWALASEKNITKE